MYLNQNIQVRWKDSLSYDFNMKKGVTHGAVLSPVLFTVYIDSLLQKLQKSGVAVTLIKSLLVVLDTLMILFY